MPLLSCCGLNIQQVSAGFSRFRHPNLDCFLQAPPSRIRSTQWQVVQVAHARHPRRNACGAMSPCPALCSWTLSGPLNQKLRHQHPAGGFTTMSQSQAQVCSKPLSQVQDRSDRSESCKNVGGKFHAVKGPGHSGFLFPNCEPQSSCRSAKKLQVVVGRSHQFKLRISTL